MSDCPSPCDVRSARHKTGLTMEEAGAVVFVSRRVWLAWETDRGRDGHRDMPPAYAQLFALKTGLTTLDEIAPIAVSIEERRKRLERKWD